jgi:hypothetical protein
MYVYVIVAYTSAIRGLSKRVDLNQCAVTLDEHIIHVLQQLGTLCVCTIVQR